MTQGVVDQQLAGPAGSTSTTTQYVYFFGDGKADGNGRMKDVLGGKGAGLAEMTNAGLPVPPGFTIQTEACREYMRGKVSPQIDVEMHAALERLEKLQGQKLGTGENPLLVSVRSGAKFSMPGMMDTILNLGLNDKAVEALAKRSNNPRFAYDSYRRLIQMFGDVVLDVPKKKFEHIFDGVKEREKVKFDYELQPEALQDIIAEYKKLVKKETGKDFPQKPLEQLVAGARCRFPQLAERPRQDLSPHQPHRRLAGHSSQRAGHGVRQPRRELRHRRRLHAQSRHRREGLLRRIPDERAGRRRGFRRAHPAARSANSNAPCPRSTTISRPSPGRWKSTIATCRISSSPSRMASSTCCRPATASAPAWPLFAWPSTWCAKASSRRKKPSSA